MHNLKEAGQLVQSLDISSRNKEELLADITHYLHSPEQRPIFIKKGETKKLGERIASLNGSFIERIKKPPFPPKKNTAFRFIDLFAGIGGFRLALQELNGKCVFSSEWDKAAKQTYFMNYGEVPFGDIRQFTGENISDSELDELIPNHEILAAGFPCQPFSRAGVSARNFLGKKTGFDCRIQGTLFFDIVRIAKVKKPKVLFLENVKNLRSHENGETFKTIRRVIEKELGYSFAPEMINASSLVPQKRERCYMVCFRNSSKKFVFPKVEGKPLPLGNYLEKRVPEKFTISDALWRGHKRRTQNNLKRGAGFTAFEADLSKPANTLVARYGKDGKECLIPQVNKNPRKLTPRECARLQGFPEKFVLPTSPAAAYKQFGNSVAVPVIRAIAKKLVKDI